jgi:hypothetical protein
VPDFICLVCALQFAVIMFEVQINDVKAALASVNRVFSLVMSMSITC